MTDAEIIKAKAHFEYGIKCDIFKEPVLSYAKTVLEAFDEINRQKAEIEGLKSLREEWKNEAYKLADRADELTDENNKLKAEIERFKKIETAVNGFWDEIPKLAMVKNKKYPTLEELLEYIENLKNEAVKELVEKFKRKCECIPQHHFTYEMVEYHIDKLVEETVGDM